MSARPDTWMPLYVGDYLADTMRLTRDQHGGYLLLIFAYWRDGEPLPDDDDALAAIVKATPAEWKKLRPIMARFFHISDGVWQHSRIDKELKKQGEKFQQKVNAGVASAAAKAQRRGNGHSTGVEFPLKQGGNQPEPESNLSLRDKGARAAREDDFDDFWKGFPNDLMLRQNLEWKKRLYDYAKAPNSYWPDIWGKKPSEQDGDFPRLMRDWAVERIVVVIPRSDEAAA